MFPFNAKDSVAIVVLALAAIWLSNNVAFVGQLTRARL